MPRASIDRRRRARHRSGRGIRIALIALLALVALLVLNAIVLDRETKSAELDTPGAELVETSSGPLQVLDTGEPGSAEPGAPIVLIHGTAGAIDWWNRVLPLLSADHRVVALDMLGYGGSEKPASGYSVENQANLIGQVMARLGVSGATVVGHSLGGKMATALAEVSPELVGRVAIIDIGPDSSYGGLTGSAKLSGVPVLGPATWRVKPDFMIRDNLEQAFAPGFDVPDEFVEDVKAMTFPAYRDSRTESDEYTDEEPLDRRLQAVGKPLLVIFGAEDRMYDSRQALSAYAAIPGVETDLIEGAGHSPQVERPEETAALLDAFSPAPEPPPEPEQPARPAEPKRGAGKDSQQAGGRDRGARSGGSQGEKQGDGQRRRGQRQPEQTTRP